MKKIETDADVLEWARTMVEAKGDKFTALSKGEQFVIAKYIMDCSTGAFPDTEPQEEPPPPQAEEPKDEEPRGAPDPDGLGTLSRSPVCPPNPPSEMPPTSKATMTRAYAYHRAGFDVQQAYDKFLEWCKEHPKCKEVMDFSTGHKSVDAAFAYWLGEIITVDVPTTTYCTI